MSKASAFAHGRAFKALQWSQKIASRLGLTLKIGAFGATYEGFFAVESGLVLKRCNPRYPFL